MLRAGGYDPGFRNSAIAVVQREGNGFSLLERKRIVTKPKQTQKESERAIYTALSATLRAWCPMALGIEDQAGVTAGARGALMAAAKSGKPLKRGSLGFNAGNDNVTGAVFMAKTTCLSLGVDYELFNLKTIKIAVCGKGSGNAGKEQVIAAVRLLFPDLGEDLSEHEADAIAAAVHMLRVLERGVTIR
jgi:Holliday junction resolvasome RuvABC endonuclease subunit